jgi:multimeric flavodoxin WrbA
MRVLGIAGSARKQGNSAILLAEALKHLRADFETEMVFLTDHRIEPCDGCHHCERHGSCRIDDGMRGLVEKLPGVDAILLASPSYMGGVTSRLRAFMERTWPLRKGQMSGKVGSYVVTGRRRIGMVSAAMVEYFGRLGMIAVPGVLGYAFEPGKIVQDEEAMDQTRRLAEDIRRCLRRTGADAARSSRGTVRRREVTGPEVPPV